MSKNKNKKIPFKGNTPAKPLPSKVFFKKIGIRQIGEREDENTLQLMEREVERRCGNDVIKKVAKTYDDENPADGFDVYHSDLRLAKIWYGTVFFRLCAVAERLAELSVPEKAKILDKEIK